MTFLTRTAPALLLLAAAGCSQSADKGAQDQQERQHLLAQMKKHPSLANGATRQGPDTALLPVPRGPDPKFAHAHHHSHGGQTTHGTQAR